MITKFFSPEFLYSTFYHSSNLFKPFFGLLSWTPLRFSILSFLYDQKDDTILNPPKADEPAGNTAGKWLMRPRRINFPPLGEIMDILIDTPLLCGGVVYY